jgi:hypothetical protein
MSSEIESRFAAIGIRTANGGAVYASGLTRQDLGIPQSGRRY